jgi:hypothetical protein
MSTFSLKVRKTMIDDRHVAMLLFALFHHYERFHTYHPVNDTVMNAAIDTVINTGLKRDNSKEERINRILGYDEIEVPFNTLVTLSRILASNDDRIHDILLYIDGKLIS